MRNSIFLLLLLTSFSLAAQNETINWYFGNNASIKFNKGNLEVLSDSEMIAPAGSSSISDDDGNLLFYTNGEIVWNKNHEIMEGGENLFGEKENNQSAIIIKKPNPNSTTISEYYIFHPRKTKTNSPTKDKFLYYSAVEISSAYPLGKIIFKNRTLSYVNAGKMTAVHHKNGKDVWLVYYSKKSYYNDDENFLYAYKINEKPISSSPTTSFPLTESFPSNGAIKFSPDATTIALTAIKNEPFPSLNLYNFNNETGKISFKVGIQVIVGLFSYYEPYGVSFSSNSKILYYSGLLGATHHILQVDLEELNGSGLGPELKSIFETNDYNLGSLQLAPDGNIYIAKSLNSNEYPKSIGFIENPNKKIRDRETDKDNIGSGIYFRTGISKMGLPNFVESNFANRIETENNCVGSSFTFLAKSYTDITSIEWNFGDETTSSEINPEHIFTSSGDKIIEAKLQLSNSQIITVYKKVTVYPLPFVITNQDLIQYDDDFDGLTTINLYNSMDVITDNPKVIDQLFFYKSENDLNDDVKIENPDTYKNSAQTEKIYVKLVSYFGCISTTSFNSKVIYAELDAIADMYSCENDDSFSTNPISTFKLLNKSKEIIADLNLVPPVNIKFFNSRDDANKKLNVIRLNNTFASVSGVIWVRVEGPQGGIQKFNAIVNPKQNITINSEYKICYNPSLKPPIIINTNNSYDRIEWRNSDGKIISTKDDYTLANAGEFLVTVYKTENGLECSNSKAFIVTQPDVPTFSSINVNTNDETNNTISFTIDGNSSYEFSLDNVYFVGNSTSHTFNNVQAGIQKIYARDVNNCEQPIQTNVSVIGFKKFFTPNGDGKNDFWNINGLDASSFKSFYIHIFDRYGKLISTITDFSSLGWDGTYNGTLLPKNNYWFKVEIVDTENNVIQKTGHFSLITK